MDTRSNEWLRKHVWLIAQETHVSLGALFVFAFKALFNAPIIGAAVILITAIVKEFTFDIWVEKASYKDGLIDWSFYILGAIAAFCLLYVFGSLNFE